MAISSGFRGTGNDGEYYRTPWARISVRELLLASLAGVVIGLVPGGLFGIAYAAADNFLPFVEGAMLACAFYGVLLGGACTIALAILRIRSLAATLVLCSLVTMISFFISWSSWEAIVLRNVDDAPSFMVLVTHPSAVYDTARIISEAGTWGEGDDSDDKPKEAVKGAQLEIYWFGEALSVLGLGFFIPLGRKVLGAPICEKCEQACSAVKVVRTTAPTDLTVLRSTLESGDFSHVSSLPAPRGFDFLEFRLNRCERCKEFNTLSVLSRRVVRDQSGKVTWNRSKTVIRNLLVTNDELQRLIPAGK